MSHFRDAYPDPWMCPQCMTFPGLDDRVLYEDVGRYLPYCCGNCYKKEIDRRGEVSSRSKEECLGELTEMWKKKKG